MLGFKMSASNVTPSNGRALNTKLYRNRKVWPMKGWRLYDDVALEALEVSPNYA